MPHPDSRVAVEYARLAAEARARNDEMVERWRKDFRLRTGHDATCTDRMALEFAKMAASVGRVS